MEYFKALVKLSKPVRKQFEKISDIRNFTLEDIAYGGIDEKLKHKELSKGLEKLYPERVALRVTNFCPNICNFCYEIPRINKKPYHLNEKEINKAIKIIENDKKIDYVLLSGGTPFSLGTKKLENMISRLQDIDHINQIYIAGSRPIFNPELWSKEMAEMISSYNKPDFNNPKNSKIVGVSTHFNHPDELKKIPKGFKKNVVNSINEFTSKGVSVYCYSTLLKGINNNSNTLRELFTLLKQNNVTPYYLVHAMDTPWNKECRVPLQEMVNLLGEIEPLSGQIKPLFIVATPIGKVAIHSNMKLEYKNIQGIKHVKLKTPYKEKEFREANRLKTLPPKTEIENDEKLIVYYPDAV